MSQQHNNKRSLPRPNLSSGQIDGNTTPYKRRRQTNQALEALGQLIHDPSLNDTDNKLNKNDILSLTLARLLREKYCPSHLFNRNVELAAGIESSSIDNDLNGFFLVLNTNGRIILLSDNVECYLRKNVRSLYPQLTSIYECVNIDDHESIRHVLSTITTCEQQVICTWNLPRGKRPSRTHTESKSMLMTGHFVFINTIENKEQQEPLFIARCEQILSSTPNIPTNSVGSTSATAFRLVLTDQLIINEVPTNTESLLGFKADELIDQSINRFIASEHLHLLEQARQSCILGQHYTTMNVVDFFTRNGDRLSFLCNIHMIMEGRRKAMKLGLLAQLIDPLTRYECVTYANRQNLERLKHAVQQDSLFSLPNSNNSPSVPMTTNILSKNEQCLNTNERSAVCPVTVLPQRRKRRRVNLLNIKTELCSYDDKAQQTPQINHEFMDSQTSSSDSLTSSASPIQEIGYMDNLFPFMHEVFPDEKIKFIEEFPSIDDINDVFGINHNQQLFLLTPTMSSLSFFP